jgi:hypothetical protein
LTNVTTKSDTSQLISAAFSFVLNKSCFTIGDPMFLSRDKDDRDAVSNVFDKRLAVCERFVPDRPLITSSHLKCEVQHGCLSLIE